MAAFQFLDDGRSLRFIDTRTEAVGLGAVVEGDRTVVEDAGPIAAHVFGLKIHTRDAKVANAGELVFTRGLEPEYIPLDRQRIRRERDPLRADDLRQPFVERRQATERPEDQPHTEKQLRAFFQKLARGEDFAEGPAGQP